MEKLKDANWPINFGDTIGLIGDTHANREFLEEAVFALSEIHETSEGRLQKVDSIVQLGDFGFIWDGSVAESRIIQLLSKAIKPTGLHLYVVLGNHEGYSALAKMVTDDNGCWQIAENITILPRAGWGFAGGKHVGWLSGATSIDREHRTEGLSWWSEEIPKDSEIQNLLSGPQVDYLFAHDALAMNQLESKLAPSAQYWSKEGLAYSDKGRKEFTDRVLSVIKDGGVVFSGHYHFSFIGTEKMIRANEEEIVVRNIILNSEWDKCSVGILDAVGNEFESFTVKPYRRYERTEEFRRLLVSLRLRGKRPSTILDLEVGIIENMKLGGLGVAPQLLEKMEKIKSEELNG